MAVPKGTRVGGRQKGTPNKNTAAVKEALLKCYERIGSDKALAAWAEENKTEFYKLWGRMLPQELTGADGGPIEFTGITRTVVRPD
jgi:hypothetical protein